MSLKRRIFLQPCPAKTVEDNNYTEFEDMSEVKPKKRGPQEDNIKIIDCSPLCKRLGLSSPQTKLWFVKDICGVICAIFTWLLVLYAEFVVVFILLYPSPYVNYAIINGVVFQFFIFLAIASHFKAMFSDPGAITKGNATKENIMKLGLKEGQIIYKCPKCCSIKPERTHHCSVCRRCIKKMDHHCPWVNNCVGEGNQKYFILFTLYICLISIHSVYMSVMHIVTCLKADWKDCTHYNPAAQTVFLIFLMFEGILFGIFTAIMCGSQLYAVCTDETGIESLKNEVPTWEQKTKWRSLQETFGSVFSIHWFNPFINPVIPQVSDIEGILYTV